MKMQEVQVEEEAASPSAGLMQAKQLNLCIICVLGYNSLIDPHRFKTSIQQTLVKHPRFSSLLMKNGRKWWWKRVRNVDLEKHIISVDIPASASVSDGFVEELASDLSKIPMDMKKPLWEFYIVNSKTSDAEATVIFKTHHSMGDGVSMMALIHACSRKIQCDPESMPSSNKQKQKQKQKHAAHGNYWMMILTWIWSMIKVMFNTWVDLTLFLATILFLKDTDTPIKALGGVVLPYKRFVHKIIDLQDVKLVKIAMNTTINDVLIGVTEAGLSHYINNRYAENQESNVTMKKKSSSSLPRNIRLRSTVVFSLRPSPTIEDLGEMMKKEKLSDKWGNKNGIVLLPLSIDLQEDPLHYIRRAKSKMDRKKLSVGHKCAFHVLNLIMSLFGVKAAATVTTSVFKNTTLTFSNVVGPQEEVNLFGHPLAYVAPSVCGFPQSLIVHYQSYAGKLIISIGADDKLIPNPHQLCNDLVMSLHKVKQALINTGLLTLC